MGSHHRPDDDEPQQRSVHPGGAEGEDHFGLFDEGPAQEPSAGLRHDADQDDDESFDLGSLRDVLAGRAEAPEPADEGDRSAGGRGIGDSLGGVIHVDPARRRRRSGLRKVLSTVIVIVIVAAIVAGLGYGFLWWRNSTAVPTDWTGTGERALVVRVQPGDGLLAVGQTLASAGVVADAQRFATLAADDGRLGALQPGYYVVHEHSAAQSVIDELADPAHRIGQLRIVPGDRLADIQTVTPTGEKGVRIGILQKIVDACVATNGQQQCFSVADLAQQAATAKPSDLGVIGWAIDDIDGAPDTAHRLEGLILPGDYDIAPGSTALEALRSVVSASAAQWNTTGIVAAAKKQSMTPYQMATVASLVQAEAGDDVPSDQAKVARVIYNRLADGMKLQFDSTVNYGLGRASISTRESERLDRSNPYSTYAHTGLTPTPIGAPGPSALAAADDPATGQWLYFVAIDLEGNSCFSVTLDEHEKCVDQARANGVFG